MVQPMSYSEKGPFFIGRDMDYGFGVFLDEWHGYKRVWHAGGWAGYGAVLVRFPAEGMSFAMMCNQKKPGFGQAIEQILQVLLRLDPAATDVTNQGGAAR